VCLQDVIGSTHGPRTFMGRGCGLPSSPAPLDIYINSYPEEEETPRDYGTADRTTRPGRLQCFFFFPFALRQRPLGKGRVTSNVTSNDMSFDTSLDVSHDVSQDTSQDWVTHMHSLCSDIYVHTLCQWPALILCSSSFAFDSLLTCVLCRVLITGNSIIGYTLRTGPS
jgi:hypothetical protein